LILNQHVCRDKTGSFMGKTRNGDMKTPILNALNGRNDLKNALKEKEA